MGFPVTCRAIFFPPSSDACALPQSRSVNTSCRRLDRMDAWCTRTHRESGLTARVLASSVTVAQAEQEVLTFLRAHGIEAFTAPLAGNSVGQDRKFIEKYMPELGAFLHYRTIDVTTIAELLKRMRPGVQCPPKQNRHRALDDIMESIKELQYYKEKLFCP